jgi:hypothetical protein
MLPGARLRSSRRLHADLRDPGPDAARDIALCEAPPGFQAGDERLPVEPAEDAAVRPRRRAQRGPGNARTFSANRGVYAFTYFSRSV